MKLHLLLLISFGLLLNGCSTTPDMGKAVTAYGNKDYLAVREISGRARQEYPNYPLVLTLHGWSQFQLGDLAAALQAFKALQGDHPTDFHGYLGEVWVLIKQGELEQAEKPLAVAERWMGLHQHTLLRATQGWLAYYRNDLTEAERQFHRAEAEIYPDQALYPIEQSIFASWSTMPWVGIGWVELAWGNQRDAKAAFEKGLGRDPSCHLCYAGLSQLAELMGDIEKAIDYATQGLEVSRHDPELVTQLNTLLFKRDSLDRSRAVYERLVKGSPDDPLYLSNLGYVYLYLDMQQPAGERFHQALAIESNQPLALSGLARLGLPEHPTK